MKPKFYALNLILVFASFPAFSTEGGPPSTLSELAQQNHCSLAVRKRAETPFPIFYCFRNELNSQNIPRCTLRQISAFQGPQPYGLKNITSIEDVIQTDALCEKNGVQFLLESSVDKSQTALEWLANSPEAGGDVEVAGNPQTLRAANWVNKFKTEARKGPPLVDTSSSEFHANQDAKDTTYVNVPVFFGTDRNYVAGQSPELTFQGERASDGKLKLGLANVTIPKVKRAGFISLAIFKVIHNVDPSKDITVSSLKINSYEEFYSSMRNQVNGSSDKDLFVFIHGYNVSFAEGLQSTGQLAYDLNFKGAAVLYSWPAGTLTRYPVAENNVEWTNRHLLWFLRDIFLKSGAKNIYLVAHSMGNRATVNALDQLATHNLVPQKTFRQVILAAPDIDTDYFKDRESSVRSLTSGLTVYASEGDRALWASRHVHEYSRLGDGITEQKICPGMDSIDANPVSKGMIGHSYITDNAEVLGDVRGVLAGQLVSTRPHIQPAKNSAGMYWNLIP